MGISKETLFHIVGIALVLSLQYHISIANVIGLGNCPTLSAAFDISSDPFVPTATAATAGTTTTQVWYLHRRYPTYHAGSLSCVIFTISTANIVAPFTNTVTVTGKKGLSGINVAVTGTIIQKLSTNFVNWKAYFASTGSPISQLPTGMYVAAYDTANKKYLVLYGCTNYGFFNLQYSWVLTTSPSSTDTNIYTALSDASYVGVATDRYEVVNQDSC